MKRNILITTTLILCITFQLNAQDTREKYQYTIPSATEPIILDGLFDESVWQSISTVGDFYNHWPLDSGKAEAKTEVRLTYDDEYIYVAAICYDNGQRIVQTLKRDQDSFWSSDGFSIMLDPINERTSGFIFGVNAGGAQLEGVMTVNNWGTRYDQNWDNKWYSEIKTFDDRWQVEMAIPFKTLRYESKNLNWGINFLRNDMERNVYSSWTQFPLNFAGIDLGYNGKLVWESAPPVTKGKVTIIPYLAGGASKNHEEGESTIKDLNAGLDAKIAVTSSLNLDLTLNPDFSNVDVDQQVTNLSRFSLFFPEKRNFFLENSDIFTNFGYWNARPFFSRSIGLNEGEQVPITFGARLSGNLTKDIRIGLMDIQTQATEEQEAQNYAVGAIQKRVLKRSNIKALMVNRNSTTTAEQSTATRDYNRVVGLEFDYLSEDGKLSGNLKHHKSFTPESNNNNGFYNAQISYQTRNFWTGISTAQVERNYITDVGFNPRLNNYDPVKDTTVRIGFKEFNPWIGFNNIASNNDKINFHGPRLWAVWTYFGDGTFNERNVNLAYQVNFSSSSQLTVRLRHSEVQLPLAADLIGGDNFLKAARYDYLEGRVMYATNSRKKVFGDIAVDFGEFYSGSKSTLATTINVRTQPWGNFGIMYVLNDVELPYEDGGSATLHLLGPKAEISFSNKMFWTTFVQYNTQAENFNINSRFQWRYKPMSDFFIVYSENYATTNMQVKNRGLVFKWTYWLNL